MSVNVITPPKQAAECEINCGQSHALLAAFNLLAPELFFLILAHPVYKM
jgi:hypothetical protein